MTQEVASGDNQGMNDRDEIKEITKVLDQPPLRETQQRMTNNGLGDNSK
ncbi:MAG: hypothetical protein CM1200mP3_10930 [Chloroflexota bacterium]|nr:MAG: hypothetical protein CM1200mP3_10930 [Chloroflexota bacterium]